MTPWKLMVQWNVAHHSQAIPNPCALNPMVLGEGAICGLWLEIPIWKKEHFQKTYPTMQGVWFGAPLMQHHTYIYIGSWKQTRFEGADLPGFSNHENGQVPNKYIYMCVCVHMCMHLNIYTLINTSFCMVNRGGPLVYPYLQYSS